MRPTTVRPPRDLLRYRAATTEDVSFLRALYGTTREEELRQMAWDDEAKARFLDHQFLAQSKHYESFYPDAEFLVIELEGERIGRLYVDRGPQTIEVIDIALMPEHRRCGIGTMLLAEILAEGQSSGKSVTIYVEHFNPARHLYDRLGFRHVDTNGVYHLMEWSAS